MRPLKTLFVLLALAALLSGAGTLLAYVTNGHAWGVSSVTYKINPTNIFSISDADLIAMISTTTAKWHDQSTASFAYAYGGTTANTAMVNDGSNSIFFRNDTNGGYIAETWWWYDGTGHLVDFDVVFHEALGPMYLTSALCSGSAIAMDHTVLHEFGHGLGLAHSADATAIMGPSANYCDTRTTLTADDIAGVEFLYPPSGGSTGGGGPTDPPPTPVTLPGAPTNPSPRNGSSAPRNANLSWTAGTGATTHDLYFAAGCTSEPALYAINLTTASQALSRLNPNTRYCWRVIEKNTAGNTVGPLWSFTTRKN
jgi:hypothetical protein